LNDNRKTINLRKTVRVSAPPVLKPQYPNLSEFEFLSQNSHKSNTSVIEYLNEERKKVTEILTTKIAKIIANNIRVNKQIIANVIAKISNIKKSTEQTRITKKNLL